MKGTLERLRRGHTSFHAQLSVEGYLRRGPQALHGILEAGGKGLSGLEVYTLLIDAKRRGLEVLPMCDNHDERGHCKGHLVPPASIYC